MKPKTDLATLTEQELADEMGRSRELVGQLKGYLRSLTREHDKRAAIGRAKAAALLAARLADAAEKLQ